MGNLSATIKWPGIRSLEVFIAHFVPLGILGGIVSIVPLILSFFVAILFGGVYGGVSESIKFNKEAKLGGTVGFLTGSAVITFLLVLFTGNIPAWLVALNLLQISLAWSLAFYFGRKRRRRGQK